VNAMTVIDHRLDEGIALLALRDARTDRISALVLDD
jgi:hypothetical protein